MFKLHTSQIIIGYFFPSIVFSKMSKATEIARKCLYAMTNSNMRVFDNHISPLTLVSAKDDGTVHCQWKVDLCHLNSGGTLHGGCTASIVDEVTSLSLMVKGKMSVSTEINVSYLRPAFEGELLDIHSKVTKAGNALAFLEAEFVNRDGKLVVVGKHTVAVLHKPTVEETITVST